MVEGEEEFVIPCGVGVAVMVDTGGEFVVRVEPCHRVGAEEFGNGWEILGGYEGEF